MSSTPDRSSLPTNSPLGRSQVEWLRLGGVDTARTQVSRYIGGGDVTEWHLLVSIGKGHGDPVTTLKAAWLSALEQLGLHSASTLFRRVFSGDPAGLATGLAGFARAHPGAFSPIGQSPVAGGSLAIWSYHLTDPRGPLQTAGHPSSFSCVRGELHHHWFCEIHDTESPSASGQTSRILAKHDRELQTHRLTLAEDVVRTWWFVRDIDTDYQALVEVRREFFKKHGLTEKTHFIASTGIAGIHRQPSAKVSLDSYAIGGLAPGQVEYLNAPDHLGPTHDYGVTFERGTAVSYADRRHLLISGTASIDPAGDIVHPDDVLRQLERTLDNIGALLAAAQATFTDLMLILVYLRNSGDAPLVEEMLNRRFPHLPKMVLHAPVCRPGWLVEIEGVAVVHAVNPSLPEY